MCKPRPPTFCALLSLDQWGVASTQDRRTDTLCPRAGDLPRNGERVVGFLSRKITSKSPHPAPHAPSQAPLPSQSPWGQQVEGEHHPLGS